jgi:hypothetical protein
MLQKVIYMNADLLCLLTYFKYTQRIMENVISIIFAVGKDSVLTVYDVKKYLKDFHPKVEPITSPQGFRVTLPQEKAEQLIQKGEEKIKLDMVNFAQEDPFCTVYIKVIGPIKQPDGLDKEETTLTTQHLLDEFANEGRI